MVSGRLSAQEKQVVKAMRENGHGYGEIAKVLNCKIDRVKNYCRNNGLGGVKGYNATAVESFERFINGFNKRHGDRFVYLFGFKNSESPVFIKCRQCGHKLKRSSQIARKNKKLTCDNCVRIKKEIEKEKHCLQLELDRMVKQIRDRITKVVKETESRLKNTMLVYECKECGQFFESKKKRKYCSIECSAKHNNRSKELRRRKLLTGDIDKDITLERLIKRDNNICYICGNECDPDDYLVTEDGYFIVGNNYPSIDHVIPLNNGGKHTWDNVRLAHHYCNTIKRDKQIIEQTGQMILLI